MSEDLNLEFASITALSLEKGVTIRVTRGGSTHVRTVLRVMEPNHSDMITVQYTDGSIESFDIPRRYLENGQSVPKIEVLKVVEEKNRMTVAEMEGLLKDRWVLKVEQDMNCDTTETYLVRYYSSTYLVSREIANHERAVIRKQKHTQALANTVSVIDNPADAMNIHITMVRMITEMLDPSAGSRVARSVHQIVKRGSIDQKKEAIRTILESL